MNGVLTIKEVATKLRVNHKTIRKMIKNGEIYAYRVRWVWRIPAEEIDKITGIKTNANDNKK